MLIFCFASKQRNKKKTYYMMLLYKFCTPKRGFFPANAIICLCMLVDKKMFTFVVLN